MSYLKGLFSGLKSLLIGMRVTWVEFFTRKVTEQYPENRATLKIPDRVAGELTMPVDANGNNKCIACGLCGAACPNGTIQLTIDTVIDPETGKSKKHMARYQYDLGSCIYCRLCVNVCPTQAIEFTNTFEHSVFTRSKLVMVLNKN